MLKAHNGVNTPDTTSTVLKCYFYLWTLNSKSTANIYNNYSIWVKLKKKHKKTPSYCMYRTKGCSAHSKKMLLTSAPFLEETMFILSSVMFDYKSISLKEKSKDMDMNVSPELVSEPGSVGDFCTTERVPKKFHRSPPPPPSFPPMSVPGMGLLASEAVRKGEGLSWNQALCSTPARTRLGQINQYTASKLDPVEEILLLGFGYKRNKMKL